MLPGKLATHLAKQKYAGPTHRLIEGCQILSCQGSKPRAESGTLFAVQDALPHGPGGLCTFGYRSQSLTLMMTSSFWQQWSYLQSGMRCRMAPEAWWAWAGSESGSSSLLSMWWLCRSLTMALAAARIPACAVCVDSRLARFMDGACIITRTGLEHQPGVRVQLA